MTGTRHGTREILSAGGEAGRHRGDAMQAFIVSDHEAISGRVRQVLLFNGLDCPAANVVTVEDAAGGGRLAQGRPGPVVLVLGQDPERALNLLAELRQDAPPTVLVVGPASSKLVLRALRGGAADYIDEGD